MPTEVVARLAPSAVEALRESLRLRRASDAAAESAARAFAVLWPIFRVSELRAVRITEMIVEEVGVILPAPTRERELLWGTFSEGVLDGHPQALSPVPWC